MMTYDTDPALRKLRRRYPGLEIVDRWETHSDRPVNEKYSWLRFQAHELVTEDVHLDAIPRVRESVHETVTFRKLVAFGETPDALAKSLMEATNEKNPKN
jgi:hypothetical protein